MRGTRREEVRGGAARAWLAALVALAMAVAGMPAPALAEAVGEAQVAVEATADDEATVDVEPGAADGDEPVVPDATEDPAEEGIVAGAAGEETGVESAGEAGALDVQSVSVADPRVVADSSMTAGQRVTWDCVWLGSYPQSFVTDAATVAALDAATGWSASGDLAYGGATYRRLREADATYSSTSSNYWQWSRASASGYCYFLWEPVKWRVLEANGSTALVVADVALDDQRYHGTRTSVTWETCDLRAWLKQTFCGEALTPEQQGAVVPQDLENANNIYYGTSGGNATTDGVFLLSESDVWSADAAARHGFVREYGTCDEARRCRPSDYARAMGAYANTSSSYLGNCCWWLRSPGTHAYYAALVDYDGNVYRLGYYVNNDNYAVRPALSISLSSNQISYAGTVSSDGTANENAAPYSGGGGGAATDAHDLANAQVSSISVQTHTGDPIEPDFTVRMGLSTLLRKGTDYTVSFANNVDVGTADVTITGAGDYHGTITRKFTIKSEADGLLGKLDLSAGFGSLSLDVPESVPIVGGDSFSLDLPVKLPAQVVVEDGKIKFGYNLPDPYLKGSHSSAQPKKAWEWTCERKSMKQQWESFCKDVRKSGAMLKEGLSKDGFLKKISDGRWKRWNVPGMQKGVEIYASLYDEYAYGDRLSDAASIEGSLVIVAKGTISLEKQWVVWIIPVTVNCDFTASATASASIGYSVANSEWYGDLDLALAIGVEPYAGVGVGKWASVGVYGSAEMGVDMKVLSSREAHGLREWYIAGEAGGRAYFAQKAFTWTMISTADLRGGGLGKYIDSGGHLRLWSKTQASVITGDRGAAFGTQSEDEVETDVAEELLATAQTAPLEAQSTLTVASDDGSLVMDAYPGAEPAVLDVGGTRILVYVGQDPSRAELDRTVLYYRVCDGSSTWGDPVPVLDDGTADCMPTVLADGSGVYVAWLDAGKTFGQDAAAGTDEYLSAFSARVARWDAGTGGFADLGRPAGAGAPYAYLLALGAGPTLTWAENADGEAFGIGSTSSRVRQSTWGGSSWSTPSTLASGLNSVTSLASSGAEAAWAVDEDNDIETPGQVVSSTSGSLPSADVTSLAYAELPGTSGVSLAAAVDGGLWRLDGTSWAEVLPAGTMGAASGFCVDGDSVYFVQADGDSSHVAVATYDAGEWGTALVTTDGGYVSSISCPCGTVALTHTEATPVEGTSEWQTASEVRVLPTTQRADVTLDAVDYATEDLVPGTTLPVSLLVTNKGTSRATSAHWSATLDGVEVASGTGAIDLMPGASGSFEAEVPLPADLGSGALSFRAWCDGDDDESDGVVEEAVVRPDLEVTAEFFEAVPGAEGVEGSDGILSVTVRNAGTADADATTTVATEAGDAILSKTEAIAAGKSVTYTREFAADDPLLPADGTQVVLVASASCNAEEFYESNNVAYANVSSRRVDASGIVTDPAGNVVPDPDPGSVPAPDDPDPTPGPDPTPTPTPTAAKSLAGASVAVAGQTYTGKALTPEPKVTLGGRTLARGTDYVVSYANNVNAGTAKVTVTGRGRYKGAATATFAIAKAANTLKAKGRTVKLKVSKLEAKAQSVKAGKAVKVSKARGKVTYRLAGVTKKKFRKCFKVAKGGKLTVKKGTPKGTYKLKVKVTAKGDANYKAGSKTVTVAVKVR